MGNIEPKDYSLRLAAEPSPLVGVDGLGSGTYPVVVKGKNRVWSVSKNGDGTYKLSIVGGKPLFAEDKGGNLIAGPSASEWVIDGPDGGPNRIRVPNTNKVWTGPSPYVPGSRIVLADLIENPQVPQNQQWYFVIPQP